MVDSRRMQYARMPTAWRKKAAIANLRLVRRSRKPTKAVKKYVKNQIKYSGEVNEKMHVAFGTSGVGYLQHAFAGRPQQNGAAVSNDLMRLIPDIAQGVTRDTRDGAKIQLTGLDCTFQFRIPVDAASSGTVEARASSHLLCRLLIVSSLEYHTWTDFHENWSQGTNQLQRKLLKSGAEPTNFLGDNYSLQFPVNSESFVTHHDHFFTLDRGYDLYDDTEGHRDGGRAIIHDVNKVMKVHLKVKSKKLKFNSPTNEQSNNFNPVAILLYTPANSVLSTTSPGVVAGNCYTRTMWRDLSN